MWIKENDKLIWINEEEYLMKKTKKELIEIIFDLEARIKE